MRLRTLYIVLIFLLSGYNCAYSQERNAKIFVDFRVNSTHIDTSYRNNSKSISELDAFVHRLKADRTTNIVNVSFCGAASPEGSYEWNRKLASGRLKSLEKLIRSKIEIPDSLIIYDDSYIPWDYLAEMVRESDISHKAEILGIIDGEAKLVSYINGRSIDSRILKLQKLDKGRVWKEMLHKFFGPMRNAGAMFVTIRTELLPSPPRH